MIITYLSSNRPSNLRMNIIRKILMECFAPNGLKLFQFFFVTVVAGLIEKLPNMADIHGYFHRSSPMLFQPCLHCIDCMIPASNSFHLRQVLSNCLHFSYIDCDSDMSYKY